VSKLIWKAGPRADFQRKPPSHETDAVAAALKRALEMPLDERRERHAPMLSHLSKNDIKRWTRSYTLRSSTAGRGASHRLRKRHAPR
jgi:trehalose 6-phosphate synthase